MRTGQRQAKHAFSTRAESVFQVCGCRQGAARLRADQHHGRTAHRQYDRGDPDTGQRHWRRFLRQSEQRAIARQARFDIQYHHRYRCDAAHAIGVLAHVAFAHAQVARRDVAAQKG